MILAERRDGIRYVRITRPEEAIIWRAAFAGCYQDVFSGPPYNERFFPSEADSVLSAYLQTAEHITLLAIHGRAKIIGFGIAVPLAARPAVQSSLRGLIPGQHSFYLADLGVLEGWRGRGVGRDLVQLRLGLIDPERYSHATLRTSAIRNASYEMYMSMGFDDMGVYMEVPARRTDGTVSTDRRLFLSKVLTPADAEAAQLLIAGPAPDVERGGE